MAKTVALCNLGCSKNIVDGESILALFESAGYTVVREYENAGTIVVNTCAFIREAKEEAIRSILDLAEYRKQGTCTTLVVCGCFSERYREEAARDFPEVDHWISVHDRERELSRLLHPARPARMPRHLTADGRYQYLKIAEGCDHRCAFCAIPAIRGSFRSRPVAELVAEARWLYDRGVRECILVAQDTSGYGRDRGTTLTALLERLLAETRFPWIRLMYLHPARVSDDLLRLIASQPRLCPYFDIPLQHIADRVLTAMKRRPLSAGIRRCIDRIRAVVPDAAIRTTFILGHPGETAREFGELVRFVEENRFERLGVFPFSPEEGTAAYALRPRPSRATAEKRCEQIMDIQRHISRRIHESRVGSVIPVIVDGPSDDPAYAVSGRSRWDAPEVDGTVYVDGARAAPGAIVNVKVTGAGDYDLFATASID